MRLSKKLITPKKLRAKILVEELKSPDVHCFKLGFEGEEHSNFTAGQFISLRFPGDTKYHSFSIASSTETPELQIVVKRKGEFTNRLFKSPVGTELEALFPLGEFCLGDEDESVMIAGGVGATPFLSMLRTIRDKGDDNQRKIWFFYSCRRREEILFEEELRKIHELSKNINIVFTLTRESPTGWFDEQGHIDEEMLEKHLHSLKDKTFYVCGPPGLVNGITSLLKNLGVQFDRIVTEPW